MRKINPTPEVSCKYGAPMGRPTRNTFEDKDGRVIEITDIGIRPMALVRIRLNNGGYDAGGAYWGHGEPLYYFESFVSDISGYVRGRTREAAKAEVRKLHPKARFYR